MPPADAAADLAPDLALAPDRAPDITLDVARVRFCPGPCRSREHEPEPDPLPRIVLDKETGCVRATESHRYSFKPHSGGRYKSMIYPMSHATMQLSNVRMCKPCNERYHEFWAENNMQQLAADAKCILRKLGMSTASTAADRLSRL
jgi:hypothetical protein